MPIARPRSSGAKALITIAPVAGTINAAPAACTARATMIHVSDWASPQAADAPTNTATPSLNIRPLPNMSPSRPPTATSAASASR
jgi:hypothetical protein